MKDDDSFLGRAKNLLARVVERGLHLPSAAKELLHAPAVEETEPEAPLPTVTLARLFQRQGHPGKAKALAELVLEDDPTNEGARALLEELTAPRSLAAPRTLTSPVAMARTDSALDTEGHAPDSLSPLAIRPAAERTASGPPTGDETPEEPLVDATVLVPDTEEGTFLLQWSISAESIADVARLSKQPSPLDEPPEQAVHQGLTPEPPRLLGNWATVLAFHVTFPDASEMRTQTAHVPVAAFGIVRLSGAPAGAVVRVASGLLQQPSGQAETKAFVPLSHSSLFLRAASGDLFEWRAKGMSRVELGTGDFPEVEELLDRAAASPVETLPFEGWMPAFATAK